MTELELKKKQLQLMKAETAKTDLECRILEREEDIKRMKEHIKSQDEIINKCKGELNG